MSVQRNFMLIWLTVAAELNTDGVLFDHAAYNLQLEIPITCMKFVTYMFCFVALRPKSTAMVMAEQSRTCRKVFALNALLLLIISDSTTVSHD